MSIAYPSPDLNDLEEFDNEPPPYEVVNGVHYPSSDGVEMGEGDWHFTALTTIFSMLRFHYLGKDVYIAGDMMLYYEEGNPKAVRAPDVMVCFGVTTQPRPSWLTWVEGKTPSVAFEVASKSTHSEDLGAKKALYERIGITEYFAFDPVGDAFRSDRERLRGWRLVDGRYEPIEQDDQGSMESEQLNMLLYIEGSLLRLIDLDTRLPVRTYQENAEFYEREIARRRELRRSMKESLIRRYRKKMRKEIRAKTAKLYEEARTERLRAEEQTRLAEEQTRLAEEQTRLAEEQTRLTEEQTRLAAEQTRLAEERARSLDSERLRAESLAAEVARLQAILGSSSADPSK